VLRRQPQVLLAAAVVAVLAAEAVDPLVLRPVVVDKRLLHAYLKADNRRELPARVRDWGCTAERLEPQCRGCSNLAVVVVHSLGREVSAVVAAAAAAVVAVAAEVAAAADNQQELAVAKWARSVAKHPWDEDHRDLDVALDNSDKVVLDWVREVLHDRLVPQSLSLLALTAGQDTVATLSTRC
jgi:hypothetical protein